MVPIEILLVRCSVHDNSAQANAAAIVSIEAARYIEVYLSGRAAVRDAEILSAVERRLCTQEGLGSLELGAGSATRWTAAQRQKLRHAVKRQCERAARSLLRSSRTRQLEGMDCVPDFRPGSDPSESAVIQERRALVRAALDALPPEQRKVALWRYVEARSRRRIAAEMQRSVAHVRRIEQAAREQLVARLSTIVSAISDSIARGVARGDDPNTTLAACGATRAQAHVPMESDSHTGRWRA